MSTKSKIKYTSAEIQFKELKFSGYLHVSNVQKFLFYTNAYSDKLKAQITTLLDRLEFTSLSVPQLPYLMISSETISDEHDLNGIALVTTTLHIVSYIKHRDILNALGTDYINPFIQFYTDMIQESYSDHNEHFKDYYQKQLAKQLDINLKQK